MKKITQKELIDLIKEKQDNAMKEYDAIRMGERWTPEEGQILRKERNKAYIDAYQDLICYLNSIEIIPSVKETEKVHIECIAPPNATCNADCKNCCYNATLIEPIEQRKPMEQKDTINGMLSQDYKERFIAEYQQTKIRYEKLKAYCNKIEAAQLTGSEEPPHDCPLDLLRGQQSAMGSYLAKLEVRAVIENIELKGI